MNSKNGEDFFKNRIAELEKKESMLTLLINNVPAYIAYVDSNTLQYRFVNESFLNGFKRTHEEIIGKHILEIIGQANYEFALKYIEMLKDSKKAISYENIFELAYGKRWIEVNYVPDFNENNEMIGIVVLSYDVTDRKTAEEERDKTNIELQKALSEIKTLKGILPFCSYCKKIRDDKGYWEKVDVYIYKHSEADISHSICPDCVKINFPDYHKKKVPQEF